jgi:N-acetylneuraminic acid mutarotase
MKKRLKFLALLASIALSVIGCPPPESGPLLNAWTWVAGSDTVEDPGSYGTQGVTDPSNMPGARNSPLGWTDATGNLWLFGGIDLLSGENYRNDLWKFDGAYWTWISGSSATDEIGNYGTILTPAGTNIPGARMNSIGWTDTSDNLWLFGGSGYDSNGDYGRLNDLWRYDGTNWTWMSGGSLRNQSGTYGTRYVSSAGNIPGGRYGSVSWTQGGNIFWLFGGYGYDSAGTLGHLNDLWRLSSFADWGWYHGSTTIDQAGTYGTKGVGNAANTPGARSESTSWVDADGNLWLFGGRNGPSWFNDLWKYDLNTLTWVWIAGSDTPNQSGVYGTQGAADPANTPGARYNGQGWIDAQGNLWLFGGNGYDSTGTYDELNDLWKFDGTNWTWMAGSDVLYEWGRYGTKGVASLSNVPGARSWSVSWTQSGSWLWLFGGEAYDSVGTCATINDLWKIRVR